MWCCVVFGWVLVVCGGCVLVGVFFFVCVAACEFECVRVVGCVGCVAEPALTLLQPSVRV